MKASLEIKKLLKLFRLNLMAVILLGGCNGGGSSGGGSDGLTWVAQIGASGGNTHAFSMSKTKDGGILAIGDTTVGLNGNARIGARDAFIARYNANGNLTWVKQLGVSGGNTYGSSISLAADGSIYIGGFTDKGIDGYIQTGKIDAFIAKYDNNGNFVWVKQLGTNNGTTHTYSVSATSDNIYITGDTTDSLNGNTQLGSRDAFIAKYDSDGNVVWVKQLGEPVGDVAGRDIGVASNGNIYIDGETTIGLNGNVQFGETDSFIAKYDANGNVIWVKQLGAEGDVIADRSLNIANDGIYIAGFTNGVKNLDGSPHVGLANAFVAKYNENGGLTWVKQLGANGGNTFGRSVDVAANGSIYVSGETSLGLNGSSQLGFYDAFIAKYNSNGGLTWVKQLGAKNGDLHGRSVKVTDNGNIYISGDTNVGLDGNTQIGSFDAYLAKYEDSK